jgi:phosphatidylethanolamine/phosphatidyl-N-methylethanolamine N-methyltransferase
MQVGALVPSSDALARCMAAQVDLSKPGLVVELGPGTGTVTRALLARGLPSNGLVIVERDANFCHLLRNRFPGVQVLHADAKSLGEILDKEGLPPPRAVISSLPLLSLDFASQRQILRQSIEVLDSNGSFVQFTYGFRSPVHPVLQRRLRLHAEPVARILRNLPPAMIWRYTQAPLG